MHLEHNLVTEIVVFKMLQLSFFFSFFFFSEIRRNIQGETLFLEENISTEQIRKENNTLTLYKTSYTFPLSALSRASSWQSHKRDYEELNLADRPRII